MEVVVRIALAGLTLALCACAPLPEGTVVQISPAQPGVTDTLRARLDGDVGSLGRVTWTWAWTRDGEQTTFTGTSVPAEATSAAEVWRVVTFPTVGSRRGTPIDAQVIIGGGDATPGQVSLSPAQPRTDDNIVATVADPDGRTWTWSWLVDDVLIGAESSTLPASSTARDQRIVAVATPDEGEPVRSAAVTVLNTPPTSPSTRVSPADPLTTDRLVCTLRSTASDRDGDALEHSFAWQVNGAPYAGPTARTAFAGDTVPSDALEDGQSWTCTAWASDGDARSPESAPSEAVRVVAPGRLVPGNTRLEMRYDGWTVRCIEWRDEVCTHIQQRVDCGACSPYDGCDVWHDTTRYNNTSDDRTARSLCAIATGDADVSAVGSGGGASAPAACGFYDEDHDICAGARASMHVAGVGIDPNLGLLLHPDYCDEDPTLLHVACEGW